MVLIVVQKIPDDDEIPHLRDSIVKLLQDFQVQVCIESHEKKACCMNLYEPNKFVFFGGWEGLLDAR